MAEYQFGSIVDRNFRLTLQRLADEVSVQGKTIQDLVADGQLTEEQYENLIATINGLIKSGEVDEYDLSPILRSKIRGMNEFADKSDLQDLQNQITLQSGRRIGKYFEGSGSAVYHFGRTMSGMTISNDAQDLKNYSYSLLNKDLWQQGSLSSADGEELDLSTRIRSKFISVASGMKYTLRLESPSAGYTAIVMQYDRLYGLITGIDWLEVPIDFETHPESAYLRVILRKNDAAVTADSVINDLSSLRLDVNRINLNTDIRFSRYFEGTPSKQTDWELGTLRSDNGKEGDNESRLRTGFIPVDPDKAWKAVWLTVPTVKNDYRVAVLQYDGNQDFISTSSWQDNGYEFKTSSNTAYIRLLLERGLGGSISPERAFSDLEHLKIIGDEILLRSGEVFTVGFNNLEAVSVESEVPYRLYGLEG